MMGTDDPVVPVLADPIGGPDGAFFTHAMDDVPFGVGLLRLPELTFSYANRVYEGWFDPARVPITGKRLDDVLISAPQMAAVFHEAARTGVPVHFSNAEIPGLRRRPAVLPGGITLWDWGIWPLVNGTGHPTHLLVWGYDMTAPAIDRLRLEQSHEEGIRALTEVSRTAGVTGPLPDFFRALAATVAKVTGAEKVVFTTTDGESMRPQPGSFGFNDDLLQALSVPCRPDGVGLAEQIVYHDHVFRAGIGSGPEFEPYLGALDELDVRDAMAVSWRAGDLRLGLVAAFNAIGRDGFTDDDLHILKTASIAAGLVWQHRQVQDRLAESQEHERVRLQEAADRMAALEQSKADFLRLASHEMRGPLTVARGYISMVEDGSIGEVSEAARSALRTSGAKLAEMARMVDQMLEAARLEDRKGVLKPVDFDIRDVVVTAVDEARAGIGSQHQLKVELPPNPIRIRADRDRVQMIVANLLDNAIKYSPRGGEIGCRVSRRDRTVIVAISDQGLGISEQDLPQLFARFSRLGGAATGAIPGTGLGLYLCREAARLHGGEIEVSSTLGEGSTFTLKLPVRP